MVCIHSTLSMLRNPFAFGSKRNILLLHPGPVNRNVDISDEMLKDPRNKVLEQVTNGVAIRAAVLKKLILG